MRPDPLMRFARQIIKVKGGCWIWIGARVSNTKVFSYGQFSFGTKKISAHRAAWMLLRGPIPEDRVVCHRCDVPMCVNPDHLFLATQQENMKDMVKKGRANNSFKTHCKNGHEFTAENTARKPNGAKRCRQCDRASALAWKWAHIEQVRASQRKGAK